MPDYQLFSMIQVDPREPSVVAAYLRKGGDPNAISRLNKSLLEFLIENKKITSANYLLKHGVDIEKSNKWGDTPLHKIVSFGNISTLRTILKMGVNVDAVSDKNGKTALYHAVTKGYTKKVHELVKYGATFENAFTDGITPWSGQANKTPQKFRALLNMGVDPLWCDHLDQNALHHAASFGFDQVVRKLIQNHHIQVDGLALGGNTPLHRAVHHGRVKVAQLLLKLGADITIKNDDGLAPFELIDRKNHVSKEEFEVLGRVLSAAKREALGKNLESRRANSLQRKGSLKI